MAGWGVNLLGMSGVLRMLENLHMRFDDDTVYITGSRVEYAIYQELGTSKMSANPFLYPAARSVERELSSVVAPAETLGDAVKLAALEIERRAAKNASEGGMGPDVVTGNLRASITAAPAGKWADKAANAALDPDTVV